MLVDAQGFELVLADGFVAGEGCDFECCGVVSGWYRATPCGSGVGCGGGPQREPIFVPVDYLCAPDGTPPGPGSAVIGFDRACWIVDTSRVWEFCVPGAPPRTPWCIPDGARVLAPGAPVACLPSCDHEDCLDARPRWITIVPCDPSVWPPAGMPPDTPLPVVRADGFTSGCRSGRAQGGDCWEADCASVFAATEAELAALGVIIFPEAIDFSYDSCCQCQCNGGSPAFLGCDDEYPPEGGGRQPVSCCCPPPDPVTGGLNAGATLRYLYTRVVEGYVAPGYRSTETWTWSGVFTQQADGTVSGAGTLRHRIEYHPGEQCPGLPNCPPELGGGCVFEEVFPDSRVPECPPPLAAPRPCPGQRRPGETWEGVRNCRASYSRRRWVNPTPPVCPLFVGGEISDTTEGRFWLEGVNYRPCDGGCGERIPTGLLPGGGPGMGDMGVRLVGRSSASRGPGQPGFSDRESLEGLL